MLIELFVEEFQCSRIVTGPAQAGRNLPDLTFREAAFGGLEIHLPGDRKIFGRWVVRKRKHVRQLRKQ